MLIKSSSLGVRNVKVIVKKIALVAREANMTSIIKGKTVK